MQERFSGQSLQSRDDCEPHTAEVWEISNIEKWATGWVKVP